MRLSRKCVSGACQRGDGQSGNETWMSIVEPELTAMQGRYRGRQTQSKTGTGLGSAGFQPHKSLYRMLAI